MPTLWIDNEAITVEAGTTLWAAARQLGIDLPALCYREDIPHVTSCMLCVVEETRGGRLLPACSTPTAEDMRIATGSDRVIEARRASLELLLSDHAGDCEAPCQGACAAGMAIPKMLRAIAVGDATDALRIIKAHIPLPATLGRICPAPCEKACRRAPRDGAVAICRLKQFAADTDLVRSQPYQPEALAPSGFSVAVVGAGPAGLSAAFALRRAGHACTLFEAQDVPGGGLRTEALRGALPPEVLDAEIDTVLQLGIDLQTGVRIGETSTLGALREAFDAVLLTLGDHPLPEGVEAFGDDPRVKVVGHRGAHSSRMAVRAVGQGTAAAAALDRKLRGAATPPTAAPYRHRLGGRLEDDEWDALRAGAKAGSQIESADRLGVTYTPNEAAREAARCLHCDCRKPDACKLRRYATDYGVNARRYQSESRRRIEIVRNGRVIYEPGKCIACGICVRIATAGAEPLGLTFIGRGFDVRVGVPFNASLEEGLQKVAAACIQACPTGALASVV